MAEIASAVARRRSAFEHLQARFQQRTEAAAGAVSLRALPLRAQIDLRGNAYDPAFRKAVNSALDCDIPVKPNSSIVSSAVTALWLGPDEWLLLGTPGTEETLISRLSTALAGLHASVVDVSDARGILEISGPCSGDLLAKGCSLDLHPRAFHPGDCAQTTLARADVILEMRHAAPTWLVYVRISFADHLAMWLLDATSEFCTNHRIDYQAPPSATANASLT